MADKIRVMVVDDSILFRNWLVHNLKEQSQFEVIGHASNAFEAMEKVPVLKPDVLTLDIEMPGMTGLELLKKLLPVYLVPVILVSSLNMNVFDALNAGAIDFVKKPDDSIGAKAKFLQTLFSKIRIARSATVRLPRSAVSASATAAASSFSRSVSSPSPSSSDDRLIAIGASTGGTEAILEVIRNLPATMPGIVITQHMPAGFTTMYAERLNRICALEVREARNGDRVRPGLVLLAPGGFQMRVISLGNGYGVSCTKEDKVNGHCPSVDVLFNSVASSARNRALGVLLTGMGADGAAGLLRMRKNGAYTIGQDKESCVVYGMPMEAYKIGAVCVQVPLDKVAQTIMQKLSLTGSQSTRF